MKEQTARFPFSGTGPKLIPINILCEDTASMACLVAKVRHDKLDVAAPGGPNHTLWPMYMCDYGSYILHMSLLPIPQYLRELHIILPRQKWTTLVGHPGVRHILHTVL